MRQLADERELAKILNIPESTVGYYRRKGKIDCVMVGKHPRYEPDKVIDQLKKNGTGHGLGSK